MCICIDVHNHLRYISIDAVAALMFQRVLCAAITTPVQFFALDDEVLPAALLVNGRKVAEMLLMASTFSQFPEHSDEAIYNDHIRDWSRELTLAISRALVQGLDAGRFRSPIC